VREQLEFQSVSSSGDRHAAVQQSIPAYEKGVTLPMWAAKLMGVFIERLGPKGLEYARFSIDSHFTRNYLYLKRLFPHRIGDHVPEFARRIVQQYKLPER
jgi:coenzyme F420 hydrogenase subunit beta